MPDKSDKEYFDRLRKNYERNKSYAKQDNYFTQLNPGSEAKFRQWLAANKVPFDPNAKVADYDMRGFWMALQTKNPLAMTGINPNDNKLHYPDTWKTPYHDSFSADSQWATPGAPKWNNLDQLVLPNGQIVFDEKAKARAAAVPAAMPMAAPAVAPAAPMALPPTATIPP